MYLMSKLDLKVLRYLSRRKHGASRARLLKLTNSNSKIIDSLCNMDYIEHDYDFPRDASGFPIGTVPDSAIYQLTKKGLVEVEDREWFNLQYVISQILVPIVIALLTCSLTLLFSN